MPEPIPPPSGAAVPEAPRRTDPAPKRPARRRSDATISGTVGLDEFLASAGALGLDQKDRERVVDQAILVIEQLYVHLPLKRAMHAVDPVQRLRLLRRRARTLSELEFNAELLTIFTELRDLHTNYLLPEPFRNRTALLPFLIEEFYDNDRRRYMVSHVAAEFRHAYFKPGVIVTHWNGIPIERAVALNAERQMGSNPAARHARGLEAMTIRPLMFTIPPDEAWVTVRFLAKGKPHECQFTWRVIEPAASPMGVDPDKGTSATAFGLGYDALTETARRVKKALFAPGAMETEKKMSALSTTTPLSPREETEVVKDLKQESAMPDVFAFRTVKTPHGTFGYIRIWTFMVNDADAFVEEFIRITELLPANGLIIDLRGNGGGLIAAGERLLQVLTPRTIEPCRLHFVNSPLTLELCEVVPSLAPWRDSIAQSVETGATYSFGFPLDPPAEYNRIGQRYYGPVLLIVDALCYSTTDIFAAGFQDHAIGPILGIHGSTGAGGANVWTHELLRELFPRGLSPFKPLPNRAALRVAIRRTTRVGERAGVPLEGLGVTPDAIHHMTANDLLNRNQDLINHAGALLSRLPVYVLNATASGPDRGTLKLNVTTRNLTRLDVFVGGRPHASFDIKDGATSFSIRVGKLPVPEIELRGYASDGATLAAVRRLTV